MINNDELFYLTGKLDIINCIVNEIKNESDRLDRKIEGELSGILHYILDIKFKINDEIHTNNLPDI